jgi:phosphatidylinositol kinase/protein kinase (PI-3  family)
MRVLRGNSDSIIAVLEAFVYDPLINWRLITTPFTPSPNDSYGDASANPLEDDFDDDDDMGSADADSTPSLQHSGRNMAMSAEVRSFTLEAGMFSFYAPN